MNEDSEIPDIRFWGLKVKSGQSAVYVIENELGLLELCHLTNVALVSQSTSGPPIFVRVRSPNDAEEYTLGALVPGKVYSFSTDLMIMPDTQFSHSGGPEDQVHLTGYRSISAEAMINVDDDDDDEDENEASDDEASSGDEDFVADDDLEDEDEENDTEDETENNQIDEDEADVTLENARRAKTLANQQKAIEKSLQAAAVRVGSKRKIVPEALGDFTKGDRDEEGDEYRSSGEEESSEEGDDDVAGWEADEEEGVDQEVQAEAVARAQEHQQRIEFKKARQRAQQGAETSDKHNAGLDKKTKAKGTVDGKGPIPAPAAKQTVTAKAQGRSIDGIIRESNQNRNREAGSPSSTAPQKWAKATGAEEQQSTSQLPPHPDDVAEPTKQYVESIVKFLRQQNGRFNMSRLGIELKRPVGALKIGRILKTYESWFRRSGMKGQEEIVLKLK